jgi:hypothetical protein
MQSRTVQMHPGLDDRNTPVELRKRILKLRWIGEETEAERLCALLSQTAQDHIVVDEPLPTD